MRKHIFGILLTLCLVVALLTCTAAAADIVDSGSCGSGVTWTLDADGLLTISGSGAMTSHPWEPSDVRTIVIESGVTSIGNYAFQDCADMTSVTIPDTVTKIGSYAFEYCMSLENVTLPASVKSFGSGAFSCCEQLKSLVIPNGSKRVSDMMFSECSNLESVTIPSSVTGIGDMAFSNCGKLTEITIPSSVKTLGNAAFEYCVGLTEVAIPNGVTRTSDNLFYNCSRLETVSLPESLSIIGSYSFGNCFRLKTVSIPNSVTRIESEAFANSALTAVFLPDGLTYLGNSAFLGCAGLKEITIPGSVTWFHDGAFRKCTGLERVVIRNGVTTIGGNTFSGCTALKTVVIPGSVTYFGANAFQNCSGLQVLWFEGTESSWNEICFDSDLPSGVHIHCINLQPQDITGGEGKSVPFSVNVSGSNLTYQWQYKKAGATSWYNASSTGADTATMTVKATTARNGMQFRCKIKDGTNTYVSDAATLTVLPKPVITTQPTNVTAKEETNAKFTVKATGDDLTYQWQYLKAGASTWYNSTSDGSKTATLTVEATAARNGMQFRCVVKSAGNSVRSSAATLTVLCKPAIQTQPKNVTAPAGSNVTFTVKATGDDLTFQWQYLKSGASTWYNSTSDGNKTATLTVESTAARNGMQFRCIVKNANGSVTSSAATLTVLTEPAIKTQPKSVSAAAGDSATFTVKATGGDLTYQWQYKKAGASTWYNSTSPGAKPAKLTVEATAARDGMQFR